MLWTGKGWSIASVCVWKQTFRVAGQIPNDIHRWTNDKESFQGSLRAAEAQETDWTKAHDSIDVNLPSCTSTTHNPALLNIRTVVFVIDGNIIAFIISASLPQHDLKWKNDCYEASYLCIYLVVRVKILRMTIELMIQPWEVWWGGESKWAAVHETSVDCIPYVALENASSNNNGVEVHTEQIQISYIDEQKYILKHWHTSPQDLNAGSRCTPIPFKYLGKYIFSCLYISTYPVAFNVNSRDRNFFGYTYTPKDAICTVCQDLDSHVGKKFFLTIWKQ